MRNLQTRHATEEQLLRLADGELSSREARRVRRHIESCWHCRAEFDALQGVIGQCVRYRKNLLDPSLPPPPKPWADLYQAFTEIDASTRLSLLGRLRIALSWPARSPRIWATSMAALIIAAGLSVVFRPPATVQAAELLQKAIAAAEPTAAASERIQIRTRNHRVTRVLAGRGATPASSRRVPDAETAVLASLESRFKAAHYDWENPLSARSFQAWRDQLPEKRDEVSTRTDEDSPNLSCYEIRTIAPTGELAEASLTLRMHDLKPVEGRLQFRDDEWVEISSLAAEPAPASEELVAMSAPPRGRELVSTPRTGQLETPFAGPADELRVFAALRQLGADLGDPIEVTREGSQVLVTGTGLGRHRREQLQQALNTIPHVVLQFADAGPPPVTAEEPGGHISVLPPGSTTERHFEKQLGGRAELDRIAPAILDASDAMMARAYALRRLSERFPAQIESGLEHAGREVLTKLRLEHAAALARAVADIEQALAPALTGFSASRSRVVTPEPWQAGTEQIFRIARQVERLLAAALGGTAPEASPENIAAQLAPALAELRARAEGYDRDVRTDR